MEAQQVLAIIKMMDNLRKSIDTLKNENDGLRIRVEMLEKAKRDEEYYKLINKEIK